jgi:hypothetical protein
MFARPLEVYATEDVESCDKCNLPVSAKGDMDVDMFKLFEMRGHRSIPDTGSRGNKLQIVLVGELPPPRRFVRRISCPGSTPTGPTAAIEPHADVQGAGVVTRNENRFEILPVSATEDALVDTSNYDNLLMVLMDCME